jgi:hypothetical protein
MGAHSFYSILAIVVVFFQLNNCETEKKFQDNLSVDVLPNPVLYRQDTISFSASLSFSTKEYEKVDSVVFEFHSKKGNIKEKLFILQLDKGDFSEVSRFNGSYFLKSPILHTKKGSDILLTKKIFSGKKHFSFSRTVGRIE